MVISMNKDFSYYLSNFLKKYLIVECNMSNETIRSYKTTFKLLIEYLVNVKGFKLQNINFATITRDLIVEFLLYLENEKNCSIRTRNQRLAAIKSFYNYCVLEEVENINNIRSVLSIKFKRYVKPIQDYLTEEELQKFLSSIDTSTQTGKRNLLLLTLLYDTAARASEILNLKLDNIHLEENYIILIGKGNKTRVVPIMDKTKNLLINYIKTNNLDKYLFSNKYNQKNNQRLIRDIINKESSKNNINKNITPHTFRRSRAIHLLSHGVNVIYIQELLGHTDIMTTQEYVRALPNRKIEAIVNCTTELNKQLPDWNDDLNLLDQLVNL